MIALPENFRDYFVVDKNSVIATKDCKILIDEFTNIEGADEVAVTRLTLTDEDKVFKIAFDEYDVFPHSFIDRYEHDAPIEIKKGEEAFRISVENNEISAPLKKLLKIIESEDELNQHTGIAHLVSDILNLLIDAKIRLAASGVEQIVRELARSPSFLS